MTKPIASIITPTFGREHLLPAAYTGFAQQSVPDIEWLVLDDSPEPSAFMRGLDDPRVRYEHLGQKISIGEKRNRLVDQARSDVIVQFDDDDYYSPEYVRIMVNEMQTRKCDFIKLTGFFLYSYLYRKYGFWNLMEKSGLHFRWSGGPMECLTFQPGYAPFEMNHYGFGFSYVFRKQVWARNPFQHLDHNEDGEFIMAALRQETPIALVGDDIGLCLHVLHQSNSAVCLPQYLLPEALVRRIFPGFQP